MKKDQLSYIISFSAFLIFIGISYFIDYEDGKSASFSFINVLVEMLKILPCAFILIGLFETWVKKETIIKQFGEKSGAKGYLWALALAGFSIGGLYVALPLAKTLHKKGASLKVIFAYLGFVGVCRIPMTIFEISFLGLPFTLVRLLITIPLFLVIGIFMGILLKRKGFSF
ncbi:MAG: permease [Bacteroidales bacterium]|nr:permease [Bacteroidales bacterium]